MSIHRRGAAILALVAGLGLAGCSKDVKVGAVISESGAVAAYGEKVKNGLELALSQVNGGADGLHNGGKVILLYRDDATIPERGRQVVQELIDDEGVKLIIGAVFSRVTLAIAPLCQEERVLLLSPTSSSPEISEIGDYIYRNYPSDIREGTSMAKFAKDLGIERTVIISFADDWGSGLREVFTQQYESRFRQVVGSFEFETDDEQAFAGIVAQIKELAPEGIYVVGYDPELGVILRMVEEAGIEAVIMTTSAVTSNTIQLAGPAAENLVYPQSTFELDSTEPAVAAFVAAYRSRYGEDPDVYAAHGYDALKLLVHAINVTSSAHPDDVRIGLNGLQDYEGAAGRTTFDKNGDVLRHPRIMIIRGGNPVPYEEFVAEGGSVLARG